MKKLFVFLACATLLALFSGCSTNQGDLTHHSNDILGLDFDYPSHWGEVITSNDGISLGISFEKQEDIRLATKYNAEPTSAQERCQENWSKAGVYDLRQENGEDIYIYSGSFRSGDCEVQFPYLDYVNAVQTSNDSSWASADEELEGTTEMNLGRLYYFDLESPILNELTVSVSAPSIELNGVCLKRSTSGCEAQSDSTNEDEISVSISEPSYDCPLKQNLKCINYAESEVIADSFAVFNASDLNEEINLLLDSMTISSAENAEDLLAVQYEEPYADFTQYSNEEFGISFTYPIAFGEPTQVANSIFLDGLSLTFYSLADAIASEEAFYANNDGGPSCMAKVLTENEWQMAYETFFDDSEAGDIVNGYHVLTLGQNKVLIGVDGKCGDSLTSAKYILFDEDRMLKIYGNTVRNAEDYPWLTPLQIISYQERAAIVEVILATIEFTL